MDCINNNSPDLICYLVTSKCVANCDICISDVNIPDLPTKESKQVISKIIESGVKYISFAGREPFLREDIFKLINWTKSIGSKINIETSGVLLDDACFKQLSNCKTDMISISIDSLENSLCKYMGRPFLSRTHIKYVVDSCRKYGIKIKINSVVSKITKNEIEFIGNFLNENKPNVWKLRQFTPRSSCYNVKERYQIQEGEFKKIVEKTKYNFPNLKIEGKTSAQQSGTAFMIFPDGQIAKPEGKGHILYGSILENNVNEVWNNYFLSKKRASHHNNFNRTGYL